MSDSLLPIGLLQSLAVLPMDKPVIGLLRHAERADYLVGDLGNDVTITANGKATCNALANILIKRLTKVYSSPVKRCVQTAHLLAASAYYPNFVTSHLLGAPGIFIINSAEAHQHFLQYSVKDIIKQLLSSTENPPGFCQSTQQALTTLVHFMLSIAVEPGIHLFITHDSILAPLLGHVFPDSPLETLWPDFLEGIFIWQSMGSLQGVYRNLCKPLSTMLPI